MRRMLIITGWLLCAGLMAVTTEVASIRGFLYGSEPACAYDNWVSHLAEGRVSTLNVYAPWDVQDNDFGDFRIPSAEELAQWAQVVRAWLALDLVQAQALIDSFGFPYEAVQFQDLDSGRLFYMLRENINDQIDTNGSEDPALHESGSFDYGWGLYIYDPSASRPMIITTPHPCDDYPSPIISLEALLAWDARFLFIAGAGREVAYTGTWYSNNNQSISDPSRYADHPFNVAYQHAATQLRGITGNVEFSVQLHTYDWNKYPNKPPVMLSSGNQRFYPNLPIIDHSRSKNDLIHNTPWEVIPANAFGVHEPVCVNQYYSIYRSEDYGIYYDKNGIYELLPVNTDLPGSLQNQQMLFTEQFNSYDTYSPFLHIEMDELPRSLEQTSAQWRQFYGYNSEQGWVAENRWTRFLSFYMPVINALGPCLNNLLTLDNGNAPSNPENLHVSSLNASGYVLGWQRSYDYDFDSYEIQTRWHDGVGWQLMERDRNLYSSLAWQILNEYTPSFPDNANMVYVRLRARDKHGNVSAWSEEIKVWRPASGMGNLTSLTLQPGNNTVKVSFTGNITGAVGYNVNRAEGNGPFSLLASYTQHPALAYNSQGSYEYWDRGVINGQVYRYQISGVYSDGGEFWHHRVQKAQPYKPLTLRITNLWNGQTDSLRIGTNIFATDGDDALDLDKSNPGSMTVWLASLKTGTSLYLSQDIKAFYYHLNVSKLWNLRAFSLFAGQDLRISCETGLTQLDGDLLLKDLATGLWHDLRAGPYVWTAPAQGYRNFELWWGYKEPGIEFPPNGLQSLAAGSSVNLNWQVVNPARVSSVSLWMVGPCDSLLVTPSLPPTQGAFVWAAPSFPMIGYRLAVKGVTAAGVPIRALSPYQYDLLPQSLVYEGLAGHRLISVPLPGWSASVDELFAPGTGVWQMTASGTWQSVNGLSGNQGYLVSSSQAWQLSFPLPPQQGLGYHSLVNGWNLLPNPHYHRYRLEDLSFDHNGEAKTYSQLVSEGKIQARAYAIRDKGWVLTDSLEPLEAVLVHCQDVQELSLICNPEANGSQPVSYPLRWGLELSAWDGFRGRDAINIGIADDAGPGQDTYFDFVKPPLMPLQQLSLGLNAQGETLQSDIQGLYPDFSQVAKTWNLTLNLAQSATLAFSCTAFKLPAGYEVELAFAGQTRILLPGQFSWIDMEAGEHTGSMTVRNYQTSQAVADEGLALKVWPNPFRDKVSVKYDPAKGESLLAEVYNLRGQKLRSLASADEGFISWDGKDLHGRKAAAGIYFIRVKSGARNQVLRVLKLD